MNYHCVTKVDPTLAARELTINAPEWDDFTARQTFPGSPHADTKCILLRGPFVVSAHLFDVGASRTRLYPHGFKHTYALVNDVLDGLNVQTVGNIIATALRPGGSITPHPDQGPYAEHFDRFHIVVTSKPGNWFEVDGERHHPPVGDVFFFNHHAVHSVGNPTDEHRIHIIVDVTLKE